MDAGRYRVGIDLGTSTTVTVLRWPDGQRRPLLFDGSPLLPSAVHLDADGRLLTGRDALHAARAAPERFEPHPKQRIDDGSVLLGGTAVPVVDLLTAVLARVAAEARRVIGGNVGSLVLTHPAAWGPRRTAVLVAAAGAAGWPDPMLVPEPVAAAEYLLRSGRPAGLAPAGPVVVYDLGGGTFDATVLRRDGTVSTVLATGGLHDAGGLDIDAAIVADLGEVYGTRDPETWRRLAAPDDPADRRAAVALWNEVRASKEALARTPATFVHVPLLEEQAPLGRERLDHLAAPVLARTVELTRQVIAEAKAGEPAGILLVGGSTRLALVPTMLQRAFGIVPTVTEQPELVVAEGSVLIDPPTAAAAPTGATGPTATVAPASGESAGAAGPGDSQAVPGPMGSPAGTGPMGSPAGTGPRGPAAGVAPPVPERRARPLRTRIVAAAVAVMALAAIGTVVWWMNRPDGGGGDSRRGDIVVDGEAVARSEPLDGATGYRRVYRSDSLAHVVGVKIGSLPASGVERIEDGHLAGGGSVTLTVRGTVQEAAAGALGNRRGAAVVLDPATGAVLAMVSTPSFGPVDLARQASPEAARAALATDNDNPLTNRAVAGPKAPGLIFSIVVAAAAFENGADPQTQVQAGTTYTPPGTAVKIQGASCPATMTLAQAAARACTTAIARYGTEALSTDKLRATAGRLGFDEQSTLLGDPANAMGVENSTLGGLGTAGRTEPIAVAQSCLGQRDVRMTPLGGALLAAAIANEGRQMRPYVVAARRDRAGGNVFQAQPAELRPSVSKEVAAQLATLMAAGVADGLARNATVPGAAIGGLAVTAVASERSSHGWFIGYLSRDGVPVAATAVFIEDAGQTGAGDAARIGATVLRAALAARG